MSFNESIHIFNFGNKASSNRKTHQILSFSFVSDVGFNLSGEPFSSDIKIVNLQTFKRKLWLAYKNEKKNFFSKVVQLIKNCLITL